MKRIIFSIYKDMPLGERVTEYSKSQYTKYFNQLNDSKSNYATLHGADYQLLTSESGYIDLNHRKIILMEELLDVYDQVLYLDFDVAITSTENIFDAVSGFGLLMEDGVDVYNKEAQQVMKDCKYVDSWQDYYDLCKSEFNNRFSNRDKYHRYRKAQFKRRMLFEDEIVSMSGLIANTGIMIADKTVKLDYEKNLEHMKEITAFENNEVFLSYLIEKNGIPYTNLTDWHTVYDSEEPRQDFSDTRMVHCINKRFEDIYG